MLDAVGQHSMLYERGSIVEAIRQYILSVTAAAVFCGIAAKLLGKKGAIASVGRLLTGLFLVFTVISPWIKFHITDLISYADILHWDASQAVDTGKSTAEQTMKAIIKSKLEAYILDKAAVLAADLKVEVTLDDGEMALPVSVRIEGQTSPYARQSLERMIEVELGISKEEQVWIG